MTLMRNTNKAKRVKKEPNEISPSVMEYMDKIARYYSHPHAPCAFKRPYFG
jgi:hypothetical protein